LFVTATSNQNSGRPEKAIESKMVGFMLAHEQFTVSQVIDIGVSDVDGNDCYLSYVPI
jgi:hypothetical protein